MPELPEVETIARTLEPLVQGRTIQAVEVFLPRSIDKGSLDIQQLCGRRIESVSRRGKLALINLSHLSEKSHPNYISEANILAVHLKMTGRLFVYDKTVEPIKHTKVVLQLKDDAGELSQLFFDDARTFGYMRLVSPESIKTWAFWNKLGVEPLEHSAKQLAKLLEGKARGIKGLLLDQHVIAGIGNIYADEALFKAGIDPLSKAVHISFEKLELLCSGIQEILRLSIEQCGSSIKDYRTANGDAGAFQNTFFVYGRAGQECKVCGSILENARIAGRTTVFCRSCQK